jgi:hypothetical protein
MMKKAKPIDLILAGKLDPIDYMEANKLGIRDELRMIFQGLARTTKSAEGIDKKERAEFVIYYNQLAKSVDRADRAVLYQFREIRERDSVMEKFFLNELNRIPLDPRKRARNAQEFIEKLLKGFLKQKQSLKC